MPTPQIAAAQRVTATVDLARFVVLRGEGSRPAPQPAHLPAKRLRVIFQMPLGFEAGLYRVRLVPQQPDQPTVEMTVRAQLRNGIASFDLEFDAQGFAGNAATLWVQAEGRGPREFPLAFDGLPAPEGENPSGK